MRKLVLFLFMLGFVSASVGIGTYNIKSDYIAFEKIDGKVNLTVSDESYDEKIFFNNNGSVGLVRFLEDNGASFSCFPSDCSSSYEFDAQNESKIINISRFKSGHFGFVLYGEQVQMIGVSFKIYSNFEPDVRIPLVIKFFEDNENKWNFEKFSRDFLSKRWGCFDSSRRSVGNRIWKGFSYCELLSISDSNKLRLGADINISDSDEGEVIMTIYMGDRDPKSCSFDPSEGKEWCEIESPEDKPFIAGDYRVCISSEQQTEYNIYKDESDGDKCGYSYASGSWNAKDLDYGIFIQNVPYAEANEMGIIYFDDSKLLEAADGYILNKYNRNCSKGCILPIEAFGASQNLRVYGATLKYTTKEGPANDDHSVYELKKTSARVDFNGTVDLKFLNIEVSKKGEYYANLAGVDIFRKIINITYAPAISSVLPANAPAGVPVVFYAVVEFDKNKSLSYSWDFGDNKTGVSNVPYITHTYNDLKHYDLSVRVSAGGNLSSERNFGIDVISPEAAVDIGLGARWDALGDVKKSIKRLSGWYTRELTKVLELDKFENELNLLEKERNESFDAKDFRDVVIKIYAMNVPVDVSTNEFESPYLLSEVKDVNVKAVSAISGESVSAKDEDYAAPILNWQNENIDVSVKTSEVSASYWNDKKVDLLTAYRFELTNKGKRDGFFIINKPIKELHFDGNVGAKEAAGSTSIVLAPGKKRVIEFYYEGKGRGSFFISPALSSFVLESDISTSCNFNKICEKELGENSKNCGNDCKPIKEAVLFFVLGVFILLIVYTILQVWYKKHYESHLFKNKVELYNLVMFVTNARVGGMSDDIIEKKLKEQKWSSEKINYVIKKSLGKSVGMIEIIPIEKIATWFRNKKVKKNFAQPNNIATGVQQQTNNNINKSAMGIKKI